MARLGADVRHRLGGLVHAPAVADAMPLGAGTMQVEAQAPPGATMSLIDRIVQGAAIDAWVRLRLWETHEASLDERAQVLYRVVAILDSGGRDVYEAIAAARAARGRG